jgi:hypothetical protein
MEKLIISAVTIATGWGFAWLAGKGISFVWPAAEVWVFYWIGGMFTLAAVTRTLREARYGSRPRSGASKNAR